MAPSPQHRGGHCPCHHPGRQHGPGTCVLRQPLGKWGLPLPTHGPSSNSGAGPAAGCEERPGRVSAEGTHGSHVSVTRFLQLPSGCSGGPSPKELWTPPEHQERRCPALGPAAGAPLPTAALAPPPFPGTAQGTPLPEAPCGQGSCRDAPAPQQRAPACTAPLGSWDPTHCLLWPLVGLYSTGLGRFLLLRHLQLHACFLPSFEDKGAAQIQLVLEDKRGQSRARQAAVREGSRHRAGLTPAGRQHSPRPQHLTSATSTLPPWSPAPSSASSPRL